MEGRELVRSMWVFGRVRGRGPCVRCGGTAGLTPRGCRGGARSGPGCRGGWWGRSRFRAGDRAVRAVRAAGVRDRRVRGVLGVGRGGAVAVVRAGGRGAGAGRAGGAGAGHGGRLAGRGRAGDGLGVARRGGGGAHPGRGGAAAGPAAAVVGAGGGGGARWVQRSEVPADARFFGLGGGRRGRGCRTGRTGCGTPTREALRAGDRSAARHDAGAVGGRGRGGPPGVLRQHVGRAGVAAGGRGGRGIGARPSGSERGADERGPLRCWVVVGSPARIARMGAVDRGSGGAARVGAGAAARAAGARERRGGAAGGGRLPGAGASAVGAAPGGRPPRGAAGAHGGPGAVPGPAGPGGGAAGEGGATGVGRGSGGAGGAGRDGVRRRRAGGDAGRVRAGRPRAGGAGTARPGECVYPDFTDPRVREWWGGLYAERLAQGFSGVWHDRDEPVASAPFGGVALPASARYALEGRGGGHREAHNVYGLAMARAGYEGLARLRPRERPFLLSRSGWAGMQRYGGAWSGGAVADWPGLRASLALVLGLGLCGVPYSGPDVGGSGGRPRRSCTCGGSSWGRGFRCSARGRRPARGGASRGSSGRRCWSTRARRSGSGSGCVRTSRPWPGWRG